MSQKDTITYGYINEEQDKQIADTAAAIMREARKDAVYFGRNCKPPQSEPSLEPYIGRIRTGYEELRTKILAIIKPEVHEVTYTRFQEETARKTALIDEDIRKVEHESQIIERELTGVVRPAKPKRDAKSAVGLGVIYCSEFLLNSVAFEFMGGLPLHAYLIGLGVTFISGILAYGIAKTLGRIETETAKPYPALAVLVAANIGLIAAMSVIRIRAMAESDGAMPLWVFLAINIGFMIGAVYFSKIFFGAKKQLEADIQLRERFDMIDANKERIQELLNQKEELNKALQKEEMAYVLVMSQAKRICERIEAHYRETVELFKTENLIARDDSGSPECFKQPVPPLTEITPTQS